MTGRIRTYVILALLLLCQNIMAQNKTPPTDSPNQRNLGIFALHPLSEPCDASSIMRGGTTSSATIPISGGGIGYCHTRSTLRTLPFNRQTRYCVLTSESSVPYSESMVEIHCSLPYLPTMSGPIRYWGMKSTPRADSCRK